MALATASELEIQLGQTFDDADTIRADQLLELASGVVEAYCGRAFARTEGDVVDADPTGQTLLLPNPPVDVTGITLDGEDVEGFVVYSDSGVVLLPSTHRLWGRVEVTYSHGLDGAPDAVKAIVLTLAGRLMLNSDGVTQKSIGDVSVSYGAATTGPALAPLERQVLDTYRIVGVA